MAGFTADAAAMHAAGRSEQTIVDDLQSADCGAPLSDLRTLLPGSDSAEAAGDYVSFWSGTFKQWRGEAYQHGVDVVSGATRYEVTEFDNVRKFPLDLGWRGGPV